MCWCSRVHGVDGAEMTINFGRHSQLCELKSRYLIIALGMVTLVTINALAMKRTMVPNILTEIFVEPQSIMNLNHN